MWTDTLNPSVLQRPQIQIPTQSLSSSSNISIPSPPSTNSTFDWSFLDSLDPVTVRSSGDSKIIKNISNRIKHAPYLPFDNFQRIQKIFNFTKIAIESANKMEDRAHAKLQEQKKEIKNLQSQIKAYRNRKPVFQCPTCLKYYESIENLDLHITKHHPNYVSAWRALRQPQSLNIDQQLMSQNFMASTGQFSSGSMYNNNTAQYNQDVPSMLKEFKTELEKAQQMNEEKMINILTEKISHFENKIDEKMSTLRTDNLVQTTPNPQHQPKNNHLEDDEVILRRKSDNNDKKSVGKHSDNQKRQRKQELIRKIGRKEDEVSLYEVSAIDDSMYESADLSSINHNSDNFNEITKNKNLRNTLHSNDKTQRPLDISPFHTDTSNINFQQKKQLTLTSSQIISLNTKPEKKHKLKFAPQFASHQQQTQQQQKQKPKLEFAQLQSTSIINDNSYNSNIQTSSNINENQNPKERNISQINITSSSPKINDDETEDQNSILNNNILNNDQNENQNISNNKKQTDGSKNNRKIRRRAIHPIKNKKNENEYSQQKSETENSEAPNSSKHDLFPEEPASSSESKILYSDEENKKTHRQKESIITDLPLSSNSRSESNVDQNQNDSWILSGNSLDSSSKLSSISMDQNSNMEKKRRKEKNKSNNNENNESKTEKSDYVSDLSSFISNLEYISDGGNQSERNNSTNSNKKQSESTYSTTPSNNPKPTQKESLHSQSTSTPQYATTPTQKTSSNSQSTTPQYTSTPQSTSINSTPKSNGKETSLSQVSEPSSILQNEIIDKLTISSSSTSSKRRYKSRSQKQNKTENKEIEKAKNNINSKSIQKEVSSDHQESSEYFQSNRSNSDASHESQKRKKKRRAHKNSSLDESSNIDQLEKTIKQPNEKDQEQKKGESDRIELINSYESEKQKSMESYADNKKNHDDDSMNIFFSSDSKSEKHQIENDKKDEQEQQNEKQILQTNLNPEEQKNQEIQQKLQNNENPQYQPSLEEKENQENQQKQQNNENRQNQPNKGEQNNQGNQDKKEEKHNLINNENQLSKEEISKNNEKQENEQTKQTKNELLDQHYDEEQQIKPNQNEQPIELSSTNQIEQARKQDEKIINNEQKEPENVSKKNLGKLKHSKSQGQIIDRQDAEELPHLEAVQTTNNDESNNIMCQVIPEEQNSQASSSSFNEKESNINTNPFDTILLQKREEEQSQNLSFISKQGLSMQNDVSNSSLLLNSFSSGYGNQFDSHDQSLQNSSNNSLLMNSFQASDSPLADANNQNINLSSNQFSPSSILSRKSNDEIDMQNNNNINQPLRSLNNLGGFRPPGGYNQSLLAPMDSSNTNNDNLANDNIYNDNNSNNIYNNNNNSFYNNNNSGFYNNNFNNFYNNNNANDPFNQPLGGLCKSNSILRPPGGFNQPLLAPLEENNSSNNRVGGFAQQQQIQQQQQMESLKNNDFNNNNRFGQTRVGNILNSIGNQHQEDNYQQMPIKMFRGDSGQFQEVNQNTNQESNGGHRGRGIPRSVPIDQRQLQEITEQIRKSGFWTGDQSQNDNDEDTYEDNIQSQPTIQTEQNTFMTVKAAQMKKEQLNSESTFTPTPLNRPAKSGFSVVHANGSSRKDPPTQNNDDQSNSSGNNNDFPSQQPQPIPKSSGFNIAYATQRPK